jgi:enamine deaminase RidA (YjgF/YER057c/UK114 family)
LTKEDLSMLKATYVSPAGAAPAQGLYSHVGIAPAGSAVAYIAGQLSVGADGSVVGKGDFEAQFAQIFSNLGDVLKGIGADFNSIVRFNTFLVHSQDIERFMTCRRNLFPSLFETDRYPPNTLLIVDRLVKEEFLLEVEAVALIQPS